MNIKMNPVNPVFARENISKNDIITIELNDTKRRKYVQFNKALIEYSHREKTEKELTDWKKSIYKIHNKHWQDVFKIGFFNDSEKERISGLGFCLLKFVYAYVDIKKGEHIGDYYIDGDTSAWAKDMFAYKMEKIGDFDND